MSRLSRAAAIRWLLERVPSGPFPGLDEHGPGRRTHFECGCSILRPGFRRAWTRGSRLGLDGRSVVCAEHRRYIGTPEFLDGPAS